MIIYQTFVIISLIAFLSVLAQPFFTVCVVAKGFDIADCYYNSDNGSFINASCGWLMPSEWWSMGFMALGFGVITATFDTKKNTDAERAVFGERHVPLKSILMIIGMTIISISQICYIALSDGRQYFCEMADSSNCDYNCSSQIIGMSIFLFGLMDIIITFIITKNISNDVKLVCKKEQVTEYSHLNL